MTFRTGSDYSGYLDLMDLNWSLSLEHSIVDLGYLRSLYWEVFANNRRAAVLQLR